MARQIELSEDARRLIAQVSELEETLQRQRLEFAAEVANVRAEVEKELARVEHGRAQRGRAGNAERQASRLAAETDRFIAAQQRLLAARAHSAEPTDLRAGLGQPLRPGADRHGSPADSPAPAGVERAEQPHELAELLDQRKVVAEGLQELASELERVADARAMRRRSMRQSRRAAIRWLACWATRGPIMS